MFHSNKHDRWCNTVGIVVFKSTETVQGYPGILGDTFHLTQIPETVGTTTTRVLFWVLRGSLQSTLHMYASGFQIVSEALRQPWNHHEKPATIYNIQDCSSNVEPSPIGHNRSHKTKTIENYCYRLIVLNLRNNFYQVSH